MHVAGGWAERPDPVSYTHLDVYKRQTLSSPIRLPALAGLTLPPYRIGILLPVSPRRSHKKLYRDMSRAAMQFLSIIALCALGTFAFSALDGTARMIRTTLNTYYERCV